jgi:drug/metabolite transporter (DMT)-like permease
MALWVGIALASALLFGASTPLSKLLLEQVSPFQLAGLLYLGAALGVSPFAVRRRVVQRVARLDRANLVRLVGAVVLGGMAGPVLLLLGLRLAAAASVSLWLNLELVATAVLGVVLFRDQLTGRAWVGAGLVVAAALLLSWEEQSAGVLPGLLVALACLCWGFDNHFTSLIDGLTPQETTLWKGLAAGATNLAIGLGVSSWDAAPGTAVAALGLGALSYGASIVLYIAAAQNIGATRGQLVFSAAPFFGVLLSVVVLGEPFGPIRIAAAALLVLGLLVLMREGHAHRHRHPAQEHEHWHRHHDGHHAHQHSGLPAWIGHVHPHRHEAVEHEHPHVPDVHHRHAHDN